MILGMHNYYKIATLVTKNFGEINFIVYKSLFNRHKDYSTDNSQKSKTYLKLYGKYGGKTMTVAGVTIFPIYACKFHRPTYFMQEINNYTKNGRAFIHCRIDNTSKVIQYLLANKEYDKSTEYNDNRISLIAGQRGKCAVTGKFLRIGDMECHHKKPKHLGGTDEYKNLIWLCTDAHILIHCIDDETIKKYVERLNLDKKGLEKVNSLRLLAENLEIASNVSFVGTPYEGKLSCTV